MVWLIKPISYNTAKGSHTFAMFRTHICATWLGMVMRTYVHDNLCQWIKKWSLLQLARRKSKVRIQWWMQDFLKRGCYNNARVRNLWYRAHFWLNHAHFREKLLALPFVFDRIYLLRHAEVSHRSRFLHPDRGVRFSLLPVLLCNSSNPKGIPSRSTTGMEMWLVQYSNDNGVQATVQQFIWDLIENIS